MPERPVILIADDDEDVQRLLTLYVRPLDCEVLTARDGEAALAIAQSRLPDLVLLDVMMPKRSGWEVCQALKAVQRTSQIAVVLVTGRGEVKDRLTGLQVGADDYLVKPFALAELLARLRALLRRRFEGEGGLLRVGDLTLDLSTREGQRGDRVFTLTRIEFDLLEMFLRHPRQVLTREVLLNRVWGFDFDSGTNSLAVYVGYLRRKLEEGGEPRCIQTVRGVGYVLRDA
jgi:two-component system response regulator MprA